MELAQVFHCPFLPCCKLYVLSTFDFWSEKMGGFLKSWLLSSQLFRNGQRLLEKQRFQFPPSWLYIDNIEGEWGAFSDIMKRKDTAIQQQVANLQMKIVQEDKAVEGRTIDLLADWEKTKPVAVRENNLRYIFVWKIDI